MNIVLLYTHVCYNTCLSIHVHTYVYRCNVTVQDNGGVIINITATLHYSGTMMQVHAGSAKAAIGKRHYYSFLILTSQVEVHIS